MNLVMLGSPAAGKGTQAKRISELYKIPHISTGDIFRQNISEETILGMEAKLFIDSGQLVPDYIVMELVKNRLAKDDCSSGFILDGCPRTINQAVTLDYILDELGMKVDKVLNIEIQDEEIIKRISGRRICKDCRAVYNIHTDGDMIVCPACGGTLYQREDDTQKVVKKRIEIFHTEEKPIIEYFREKNLLIDIDGLGNVDEVTDKIVDALESDV